MRTYFDSAVLVKAYCLEDTTEEALSLIKRAMPPLLFTPLHALEIRNALRLKRYRKELTGFQLRGALRFLQEDIESGFLMTPEHSLEGVFGRAEALSAEHAAAIGVRSLDILHVAAALILEAGEFVSFDRTQRPLAAKAGLKVLPRILPRAMQTPRQRR